MSKASRPIAVLVDAYTSGNYLPPAFARLAADVVHVQSTPELIPTMLPPDLDAYVANIVNDDPVKTAAQLAAYEPVCVVAGQEPGVPLADELSELMGLPTNGTASSSARRNKYEMIETLRRAGIRCASQFKGSDPDDFVAWAERNGQYPFVVKPLNSAATDGVRICRNPDEVRDAVGAEIGTRTIYGDVNEEVLIQTFLAGTEYVVDMVAARGQTYCCGVWEYHKEIVRSTRPIYDRETVVASDAASVADLVAYVDTVLQALNIRHGPAHAEVMLTPEGPALVEIGARLSGNMHPGFHDVCVGGNQADMTALAYLRPAEFLDRFGGTVYRKRQEALCYTAPTTLDGVVESVDQAVVDQIHELPAVYGMNVKIKPGGRIRPTVDLYTSILRVFLTAPSYDDVMRDYTRVRELKDKVYRLK